MKEKIIPFDLETAKKIQDILAEEVKRGKRCLYLSRHDQKMLRGAGRPAIDMLTYIFAKEEEKS